MATPVPSADRDRWLALGLLLAVLLVAYALFVHPWWTAPMLQLNERIAALQERELRIQAELKQALTGNPEVDQLADRLMDALANPEQADDAHLPRTGVPQDWERLLSSCFIRSPDGAYGTRCSTVLITERLHKRLVTHVFERTFTPTGMALLRRVTLKNWPPRHTMAEADVARLQASLPEVARPASEKADKVEEAFESSEVHEQDNHVLPALKRSRARNLIKAPVLKLLKA